MGQEVRETKVTVRVCLVQSGSVRRGGHRPTVDVHHVPQTFHSMERFPNGTELHIREMTNPDQGMAEGSPKADQQKERQTQGAPRNQAASPAEEAVGQVRGARGADRGGVDVAAGHLWPSARFLGDPLRRWGTVRGLAGLGDGDRFAEPLRCVAGRRGAADFGAASLPAAAPPLPLLLLPTPAVPVARGLGHATEPEPTPPPSGKGIGIGCEKMGGYSREVG